MRRFIEFVRKDLASDSPAKTFDELCIRAIKEFGAADVAHVLSSPLSTVLEQLSLRDLIEMAMIG